jgi:hypothetical protein
MTVTVNPECRSGKHRNCDGYGWHQDEDQPAPCPCDCHGGPLLGVAYPEGGGGVGSPVGFTARPTAC